MENNQFAVEALYTPQRVPHYRGNPLIEALPPAESEESMMKSLLCVPDFDEEQRGWQNTERIPMVMQLSNFMLPMDRHLQLCQSIDMLIRQGYVGREPNTPAYYETLAKLYEQQKSGSCFEPSSGLLTPQLSGCLIGVSGVGKTTTLRRILGRYPKVIYHPALNHYQVPYLMVETPYNGAGVKELAESIFRKMDLLLPDSEFSKKYSNPKSGAGTLMNHAAKIIQRHSVGMLVVDEIQNLENSSKNRESLMTLLVSASNELGVPILFVGTNKATKILTLDFRQGRRSTGLGSAHWGALARGGSDADSEWEDFLGVLFRFQWVKTPLALTQSVADLMFHYTQGIVDVTIKLFALSQVRAIYDGSDALTAELIADVARKELALVQPMIAAVRNHDISALESCPDIAPVGLEEMMSNVKATYAGRHIRSAAILSSNPQFLPEVAGSLQGMGFEGTDALELAGAVKNNSINVIDGVKNALHLSTSGSKARRKGQVAADSPFPDYPLGDYRNALNPALGEKTVYERLLQLNMVADVEAMLGI